MKSYLPKLYFNKYTTVPMLDNQSISPHKQEHSSNRTRLKRKFHSDHQ